VKACHCDGRTTKFSWKNVADITWAQYVRSVALTDFLISVQCAAIGLWLLG
jgi:hypothetical protein